MKLLLALSVVIAALATPKSALAKPEYRSRIPNGFNVPGVAAVGHTDPQGDSSSLNVFGRAFDGASKKWSTSLCHADSDGDGQTNGQELGDPCCEWTTASSSPRRTTGLSDPGVATSKTNASLWADVNCSSATPISAAASTSMAYWTTPLAILSGFIAGALAAARN